MLTNKEIQERITQELKPDVSFEAFCENHGIEYKTQRRKPKKSAVGKKIFIPVSAVAVIALCIGLPVAFRDKPSDNGIILYGDADVSYNVIRSEDLSNDSTLLAFDLNKSESYSEIKRIFPTEKSDLTVGFTIKEVLYGFECENVFYAYDFDYIVRCYEGYKFSDLDQYTETSNNISNAGIEFKYAIREKKQGRAAYITFENNGYDYYINLRGYEDMTEINRDSVEIFIRNIF